MKDDSAAGDSYGRANIDRAALQAEVRTIAQRLKGPKEYHVSPILEKTVDRVVVAFAAPRSWLVKPRKSGSVTVQDLVANNALTKRSRNDLMKQVTGPGGNRALLKMTFASMPSSLVLALQPTTRVELVTIGKLLRPAERFGRLIEDVDATIAQAVRNRPSRDFKLAAMRRRTLYYDRPTPA